MDFEYVALIWKTHKPEWDTQFVDEKADLVRQGWRDHIEVPHATGMVGGVCIMRRLKDEPRMWTESGLKTFIRKLFDEDAVLRGGGRL